MKNAAEIIEQLHVTLNLLSEEYVKMVIIYFPLWGVLYLGLWAVYQVVYGVLICKSCPEAALELEVHVKSANAELLKRGFAFSQ